MNLYKGTEILSYKGYWRINKQRLCLGRLYVLVFHVLKICFLVVNLIRMCKIKTFFLISTEEFKGVKAVEWVFNTVALIEESNPYAIQFLICVVHLAVSASSVKMFKESSTDMYSWFDVYNLIICFFFCL